MEHISGGIVVTQTRILTVHIRLRSQTGVAIESGENIGIDTVRILVASNLLPEPVCGEISSAAHWRAGAGDGERE